MGMPEPEQMKVSVQMGEHIIRMNQRLRKVMGGGWVGGGAFGK